jgi:hypothetical protein
VRRELTFGLAAACLAFGLAHLFVVLTFDPQWTTSSIESVRAAMARLRWGWILPGSAAVGAAVFLIMRSRLR